MKQLTEDFTQIVTDYIKEQDILNEHMAAWSAQVNMRLMRLETRKGDVTYKGGHNHGVKKELRSKGAS